MRWATRAGIHVDRTACAWLIRRFIDPECVFVFVHDPVREIARIVHEADLEDERYDAPEAGGLDVILRGLSLVAESEEQMLALNGPIYDGLYEYRRRATMLGREPS
jgi:hypothetical protein